MYLMPPRTSKRPVCRKHTYTFEGQEQISPWLHVPCLAVNTSHSHYCVLRPFALRGGNQSLVACALPGSRRFPPTILHTRGPLLYVLPKAAHTPTTRTRLLPATQFRQGARSCWCCCMGKACRLTPRTHNALRRIASNRLATTALSMHIRVASCSMYMAAALRIPSWHETFNNHLLCRALRPLALQRGRTRQGVCTHALRTRSALAPLHAKREAQRTPRGA